MSLEDEIIAEGLRKVREGILSVDWSLVCDGYNSISGEDLSVEEKKDRLSSIREKLFSSNSHEDSGDEDLRSDIQEEKSIKTELIEPLTNWSKFKIDDIKTKLTELGVDPSEFENIKLKKDLIDFAEKREKSLKTVVHKLTRHKGDKFAKGEVTILSSEFDEREYTENAKKKRLNPRKLTQRRTSAPKDTQREDAPVRFRSNPDVAPPWR